MTLASKNRRVFAVLAGVVAFTGGAAWASVPLYDWFCRVTGYGGTTVSAEVADAEILEKTIQIRFDASLERGMPWDFKPLERQMEVRIGESVLAYYQASNPTDFPVAGTASFNVYPFTAGGYFVKLDCFCFEEQVLQPGESVVMPVNFYVDPEILNDQESSLTEVITLSYTFHETELPTESPSVSLQNNNSESLRGL